MVCIDGKEVHKPFDKSGARARASKVFDKQCQSLARVASYKLSTQLPQAEV